MALIQAGCIIRPSWTNNTGGSSITWSFVNDADHRPEYFTSVAINGSFIEVSYPPVSKIISFVISPDETLQKYGVVAGATVGLSSANIQFSALYARSYQIVGNGTNWNSSPLTNTFSAGSTTLTGIPTLSSSYAYGTVGQYMGTNPYIVRPVLTSIGIGQWKFQLVDMTTGLVVTTPPTSDDKVLITPPMTPVGVPISVFDGDGFAKKIYEANSAPANSAGNFFIMALFEIGD